MTDSDPPTLELLYRYRQSDGESSIMPPCVVPVLTFMILNRLGMLCRPRFLFAPNDPSLPTELKVRIGGWRDRTPNSQFQQYGPINKYLNLKFNRSTHLVKPQCLFRRAIDQLEDQLLVEFGEEEDGPVPDDNEERTILTNIRSEMAAGHLSFDSTHRGELRAVSLASELFTC